MNRRKFIANGVSLATLSTFPFIAGFSCDSTTVADFVSLIGTDAAALATYFGQQSLAIQLSNDAGYIVTDIQNWKNGGAVSDAIQAINDMIALIGTIPIAQNYAPLIILLASALSGLLALLPQAQVSVKASAVMVRHSVKAAHYGGFDKKSMGKAKAEFAAQWKSLTVTLPVVK